MNSKTSIVKEWHINSNVGEEKEEDRYDRDRFIYYYFNN